MLSTLISYVIIKVSLWIIRTTSCRDVNILNKKKDNKILKIQKYIFIFYPTITHFCTGERLREIYLADDVTCRFCVRKVENMPSIICLIVSKDKNKHLKQSLPWPNLQVLIFKKKNMVFQGYRTRKLHKRSQRFMFTAIICPTFNSNIG